MRAVQPRPHKLFSGHAFALRDLRFVVRKDIVYTAAMDVDLIAEERGRHRAALDVPAGTSWSPWRIPFHIAIGDVHDAMNFESARLEMALKQIFENVGAKISDVGAAVNRRSAGVDVDLAILRVAQLKFFGVARVSIKEAQRHS